MGEKDYEVTYKILILGDSGVGKTCLIFRFIENIFSDSYISTIGKLVVLQSCKETCIFDDELQNKLDLVYEKRKLINQNKMFLAESKERSMRSNKFNFRGYIYRWSTYKWKTIIIASIWTNLTYTLAPQYIVIV